MAYQGWGLVGERRGVDGESSDCGYIPGLTWHDVAWGSRAGPEGRLNIGLGESSSFAAL